MPPQRAKTSCVLTVVVCAAFGCGSVLAQPASDEYRLKAAFLYRFPEFVEWPPAALEGRQAAGVCVAASTAFTSVLRELVSGQGVGGRPFVLRRVSEASDIDACHVLFVSTLSVPNRTLLRRAQTKPILTVGDDLRFLDDGGVVQLRVVESRVRFEISATAAQQAGLRLSSQLLRLALNVRGAPL